MTRLDLVLHNEPQAMYWPCAIHDHVTIIILPTLTILETFFYVFDEIFPLRSLPNILTSTFWSNISHSNFVIPPIKFPFPTLLFAKNILMHSHFLEPKFSLRLPNTSNHYTYEGGGHSRMVARYRVLLPIRGTLLIIANALFLFYFIFCME